MDNSDMDKSEPGEKSGRKLLLFAGSIIAFLMLFYATLVWTDRMAYTSGVKQLEREGHATKYADWRPPVCAESENALPIWEKFRSTYEVKDRAAAEAMNSRASRDWSTLTESDRRAMRDSFAANAQAIKLLEEASSLPCFTFKPDLKKSPDQWDFPQLVGLSKPIRQLTYVRGRLAFESGDTTTALECVRLGAASARSFARLPLYINSALATMMLGRTLDLAEHVLPGTTVPDSVAAEVFELIDPDIYRNALADSLEGDRLMMLHYTRFNMRGMFSRSGTFNPVIVHDNSKWRTFMMNVAIKPMIGRDGIRVQRVYLKLEEVLRQEPWESEEERRQLELLADIPAWRFWANATLLSLARNASKHDVVYARAEVIRTALACKRYATRNGEAPKSLADLVPEYLTAIPKDPFTGNEMGYEAAPAGGFKVYSVGPDKSDGHSAAAQSGGVGSAGFKADDIVWSEPAVGTSERADW